MVGMLDAGAGGAEKRGCRGGVLATRGCSCSWIRCWTHSAALCMARKQPPACNHSRLHALQQPMEPQKPPPCSDLSDGFAPSLDWLLPAQEHCSTTARCLHELRGAPAPQNCPSALGLMDPQLPPTWGWFLPTAALTLHWFLCKKCFCRSPGLRPEMHYASYGKRGLPWSSWRSMGLCCAMLGPSPWLWQTVVPRQVSPELFPARITSALPQPDPTSDRLLWL